MIDINDVLRVVYEWDIPDGTIAQLVTHYIVTAGSGGVPATVLASIVTTFEAAWLQIDQIIDTDVTGAGVELFQRDVALAQWDGVAQSPLVNADGTLAAEMIPHGAAGLIKLFTESNRRQGRKYVMGLTETHTNAGTLNAAALTALALFANDFDNVVTSGALTLVNGTYNTIATSPLFESFSKSIQSVQAEAIIAYQRRRRPGTGI